MGSVIGVGRRPGRQRERTDTRCALSVGKHKANSGWTVPVGSSSSGASACIASLIPLVLRPPLRRHRPSRNNQRLVLALATPGANPFSDGLLPLLWLQKRRVQNNETHPKQFHELQMSICLLHCSYPSAPSAWTLIHEARRCQPVLLLQIVSGR